MQGINLNKSYIFQGGLLFHVSFLENTNDYFEQWIIYTKRTLHYPKIISSAIISDTGDEKEITIFDNGNYIEIDKKNSTLCFDQYLFCLMISSTEMDIFIADKLLPLIHTDID